jgi:hypothetical protein
MDPDPGGPKTNEIGSGTATLVYTLLYFIDTLKR